MKLKLYLLLILTLTIKTVIAANLQALEAERELHRLAKIKLHGEPLKFDDYNDANKVIAFSPDGKYLAVAFSPGPVLIYNLPAEKNKELDRVKEMMRKEVPQVKLNNLLKSE